MFKLFLVIIIIYSAVFSQTNDIKFKEEISLETINVPLRDSITFTLTSIGTCWANDLITRE